MSGDEQLLKQAVDSRFEAMQLLWDLPELKVRQIAGVWWVHRYPRWPEIDHFYATEAIDPATVASTIRLCDPAPSYELTIYAAIGSRPENVYALHGFVRQEGFAQPFMMKTVTKGQKSIAEVIRSPLPGRSDGGARQVVRYSLHDDGVQVSTALAVSVQPDHVYISGMETLEPFRRRGLGRKIVEAIMYDAHEAGMRTAILCASNVGQPLYEATGFTIAARMIDLKPAGVGRR